MQNILKKLWDSNEREVKKVQKYVEQVNAWEPKIQALSDQELRAKTAEFQQRVRDAVAKLPEGSDEKAVFEAEQAALNEIHPEAFAVVREAAQRVLGQRHYDVQILGGTVLHQGRISEMKTGEGKTLVATLPIYLNALAGHGVHLVTANDYLSKHGAQWMGPVYHFLGLSIGLIQGASSTAEQGQSPSFLYDPTQGHDERIFHLRPCSRKEAYFADITYGTNNEFGFDYLRDNMAFSHDELVQRDLYYAIVDEVDSILIDEARTPLIIAGLPEDSSEMYYRVDRAAARLEKGRKAEEEDKQKGPEYVIEIEKDVVVDEKTKSASPTDAGVAKLEQYLGVTNIADDLQLMHHIGAALKARFVYRKDIEYVVKEGEVVIVDEFTGRLMFGRRYSDGLHQAIEAKEGVKIESETQTIATITFQNYFRLYQKLSGMTGTAKTEESEFRKIYGLDVVVIPTNRPLARKDAGDVIYKTEEAKFRGAAAEILMRHCARQPVLVGTRSIEVSERLSDRLKNERLQTLGLIYVLQEALAKTKSLDKAKKAELNAILNTKFDDLWVAKLSPVAKAVGVSLDPMDEGPITEMARIFEVSDKDRLREVLKTGIPHKVLNAKYHEKEASIIAEAGRAAAVTIATNMAGRGVDILLGGSDVEGTEGTGDDEAGDADIVDEKTLSPEEKAAIEEDRKRRAQMVRELGGLFVIGTERHESRRIDNQLRGRSGRQGDPGGSRFFLSLEDELWRLFGDRGRWLLNATWEDEAPIEAGLLTAAIERAQKRVEENNFATRKHVLEYDDVMNLQRKVIYSERRKVLDGVDLKDTILSYLEDTVRTGVNIHAPAETPHHEWDLDSLFHYLNDYFPLEFKATPESLKDKSHDELADGLWEIAQELYEEREAEMSSPLMRELERWVVLQVVNSKWVEHLSAMDHLREGVTLRAYGQQDPLVAYKKEAFEMFQALRGSIADDVVRYIFHVHVQQEAPPPPPQFISPMEIGAGDIPMDGMLVGEDTGVMQALAHAAAAAGLPHPSSVLTAEPAQGEIGRNDPCPCGSGKKYKKCHGAGQ
jgi:preprotein translocase subunit SecA